MAVNTKKRACDRCNRLKQVCSGRNPCESCERVSADCTFKRPVARIGRPKLQLDKYGNKVKGRYSHNACANCKVKKKKCDESWPTCSNCDRLNITCSGPLKIIKVTPADSDGHPADSDGQVETNPPTSDKFNASSEENQENRPAKTTTEGTQITHQQPFTTSTLETNELLNVTRSYSLDNDFSAILSPNIGNMVDLTNDLFSLENNDLSSREKLFLNSLIRSPTFPIDFSEIPDKENAITPANDKTIETVRESSRPIHQSPLNQVSPSSVRSSDYPEVYEEEKHNLLSLCTVQVYKHIPKKELDLMQYFITDVSCLLFVDKASTRFLRTVIPSSLDDPKVRYPIISIAASHRANNDMGHSMGHKRDAAIYRAKSQSSFIGSTVDYFESSENILLSVLLIAVQEILEGTSLYWTFALEKAANIIDKRGGLKKVSTFAPLSIQLFCYLDLISSLSTCSSPYVDRTAVNVYGDDEHQIERILNNKFGFKFGIAGEIFKIIGNISTLSSLRDTRYKTKENEQRFNTLANLVEMKLQNWSPTLDLVANTFQIDNSIDEGKLILSSFTLALQWSAFLRLHQIRHGYNRQDSRITACLEIILRSMKVIQNNSDLETGLMFPLIMAGSVAYKAGDREYIMSRIRSIKQRLKFSYIGEFENLISQVWSRDSEENHGVNWAKIRYFEYPGLVMF